jgi:hypothetical protein
VSSIKSEAGASDAKPKRKKSPAKRSQKRSKKSPSKAAQKHVERYRDQDDYLTEERQDFFETSQYQSDHHGLLYSENQPV